MPMSKILKISNEQANNGFRRQIRLKVNRREQQVKIIEEANNTGSKNNMKNK